MKLKRKIVALRALALLVSLVTLCLVLLFPDIFCPRVTPSCFLESINPKWFWTPTIIYTIILAGVESDDTFLPCLLAIPFLLGFTMLGMRHELILGGLLLMAYSAIAGLLFYRFASWQGEEEFKIKMEEFWKKNT